MNGGTESDDFILLQDDQLCAELYPEVYGNSDRELEQEPKLYSPWSSADEEFEDMDRRVIEVSEEEEVEVERRVVEYECEPAVQFAECSTSVQERRILEYTTAGVIVDLLCGFCVEGDHVPHLNNLNGVSGTHLAKSWEEFLSLSEMKRKVGIHEINLVFGKQLQNLPTVDQDSATRSSRTPGVQVREAAVLQESLEAGPSCVSGAGSGFWSFLRLAHFSSSFWPPSVV